MPGGCPCQPAVLAWPVTGLVTVTPLALATLIGQSYLTELVSNAADALKMAQVQDKLLAILEARLKEVKESLTERFDAAMESLRAQTLAKIRVESKAGLTHENNIF